MEKAIQSLTRPGDIWCIGPHRLMCGDCRNPEHILRLIGNQSVNVVVTSPPYATRRRYDSMSGFEPVRPDRYVGWYEPVAHNLRSVLASDGSYFLNIKAHSEDGERHTYVMDLVLAHKRQWGWRFVDEFCWRKTDNGVPGGCNNRFKNAWEPIFHFSLRKQIKFRPLRMGWPSNGCFEYTPDIHRSSTGSRLLSRSRKWEIEGLARPSNVIEIAPEKSLGVHSAPFPRKLPEFFIQSYSDPGDVVLDPFLGSGTTMIEAARLDRVGLGMEISPLICDTALQRFLILFGNEPHLESGETLRVIEERRGCRVTDYVGSPERVRYLNGMPAPPGSKPSQLDFKRAESRISKIRELTSYSRQRLFGLIPDESGI